MADQHKRKIRRPRSHTTSEPSSDEQARAVELDPAVERGERIATGKHIARGGKDTGPVPGATETTEKEA